jgi:peptidyl-prolyl cis-trans isomerase SurA
MILAAVLSVSAPAFSAESRIAAVVNGDIITSYELEGRLAFTRDLMKGQKPPADLRERILDEMVNDRIKLAEAAKFGVKVDDKEIDDTVSRMEKFYGVKVDKSLPWVRDQARADVAWNKFLFGYLRSMVSVGDAEVDGIMESRAERKSYEYSVVPLLAGNGDMEGLLPLAKGVSSCAGFKSFAKKRGKDGSGTEIRVKDSDMNPALAAELAGLGDEGLAGPVENAGGLTLFYMCSKRETEKSALPPLDRSKVRQDLLMGKLEAFSERYFEKVRAGAAVEIRK